MVKNVGKVGPPESGSHCKSMAYAIHPILALGTTCRFPAFPQLPGKTAAVRIDMRRARAAGILPGAFG